MKIRATTNFFWNGQLIPIGTIISADKKAKQQLVDEDKLCEMVHAKLRCFYCDTGGYTKESLEKHEQTKHIEIIKKLMKGVKE